MILGHILSHERPSSCFCTAAPYLYTHCADTKSYSNLIGLAMAAENIESLLKDAPTHVVAGQGQL